jgi:acyl carrier protein
LVAKSGSLVIFAAMRRASSLLGNFAAQAAPGNPAAIRRISYKHRRTLNKPLSATSCARSRYLPGREKSGETMDARAAPHVGFDANKIRALIAKYLGIDAERVTDEAHFRNDFELDSLDQLELLILLEEEFFGAEFSDAAVEKIEVVGDLIQYMEVNCMLGKLYAQTFHHSPHV